jgi:hypothetical protein
MEAIDHLALLWGIAKGKEDAARAERIKIEEDILKAHPAKEEGSETFKTANGVTVTLTGKVTYRADIDRLIALTGSWPDDIRPIKSKVEADETRLKAIRNERPDLWRRIAEAVETKAAKTGVTIKFKE